MLKRHGNRSASGNSLHISFIFLEDSRRNAEVFSAWQTITSAEGQSGSGGRIEALEFLNYRPLKLPLIGFTKEYWYWDQWSNQCKRTLLLGYRFPRQSLSGLSAPKAYLHNVKLCGANLSNSNLQDAYLLEAHLENADLGGYLKNADLREANLENADLLGANLQEANLGNANLVRANLENTNLVETDLSGAIYTDSESTIWCSNNDCGTVFPDGFDPKKAGMILMKTQEDYDKWKESRQK